MPSAQSVLGILPFKGYFFKNNGVEVFSTPFLFVLKLDIKGLHSFIINDISYIDSQAFVPLEENAFPVH